MNLDQLQRSLIKAGRANAPSDAVPRFFSRRVLAHISSTPPVALFHDWMTGLWRGAVPCAVLALALAGWTALSNASADTDWSEEFENAVIVAAIEHETETSW